MSTSTYAIEGGGRSQGCSALGRRGRRALPISSNLKESWSKGSHAGRGLATVFSGTFCFSNNSWSIGQNASPPTEGVSAHHWW